MRIAISAVFTLLIAALVVCAFLSKRSKKGIASSVRFLINSLIPPLIGNLIIILSSNKILSEIGYYFYFLGMNFVVLALLRFTFDYCDLKLPKGKLFASVYILLAADAVQLLLNLAFGHAFSTEAISAYGSDYYRLIPHLGQTIHRVVDYGIFFAVIVIFVVKVIRSSRINSEKYSVILFAMIFTGIWETFYIFSRTPVDRSMIGFGVFGILVYFLSLRYKPVRLLDRMLAMIASEMPEALFCFDSTDKCIWANQRAKDLLGLEEDLFENAGESLLRLFNLTPHSGNEWTVQKTIGSGDDEKSFVLEKRTVSDSRGRMAGSFLTVRDNTAEQQTLQREIYNATHDPLTKLYNRAGYDLIFPGLELGRICMLLIDVDYFKQVNDTYGHEMGDRVLKRIADTLRRSVGSENFVFRIGGDEFIILMPHCDESSRKAVSSCVERVNSELSKPFNDLPAVTVSVGASFGGTASDRKQLYIHADRALYNTKRKGRNGCTFFEPENMAQKKS